MITAGVCPEFQLSPTHEFKNVVFLSSVPIIVFHFILLASVRTLGKKKKKAVQKGFQLCMHNLLLLYSSELCLYYISSQKSGQLKTINSLLIEYFLSNSQTWINTNSKQIFRTVSQQLKAPEIVI